MSGKFSGIGGLGSAKHFLLEFQGVDLWMHTYTVFDANFMRCLDMDGDESWAFGKSELSQFRL
jgi:hypothetical protein